MPLDHVTEYALSFTSDAVHLMRREVVGDAGWQAIGSADFASASFRSDLAALRAGALNGDARGALPVVLLIPQDQILYTSLSVPSGPSRDRAVGKALDGLTPYTIEDLSFDWTEEGADVRVAAVARQTLHEAQEFAMRHGFQGTTYSAQPDESEYPGMPVFRLDGEEAGPDLSVAGPEALSLDLDADLPDETPGGSETATGDQPALPVNKGITDIDYEVVGEGKAAPDDGQPALPGLDLAETATTSDAPSAEEEVEAAPVTDSDQADLFDGNEPAPAVLEDAATGGGSDSAPPDTQAAARDAEVDGETSTVNDAFGAQDPEPAETSAPDAADSADTPGEAEDHEADSPVAEGIEDTSDTSPEDPADDLTEAERAALAVAAEEIAAAEAAAAETAQRARQAAARTVVRHPLPGADATPPLRAAETRTVRAATRSAEGARPGRGGLVELVAMLGALVVGLLLVWAFIVPRDNMPTGTETIAEADPVMVDSPEPEVAAPASPTQTDPAAIPAAPTEPEVSTTSALSPDEQALVIAIATAPAELIVIPSVPAPETVPAPVPAAVPAPENLPVESAPETVPAQVVSAEAVAEALAEAATQPPQSVADTTAETGEQQVLPEQVAAALVPSAAADPVQNAASQPAQQVARQSLTSSARPLGAPRRQAAATPVVDAPPVVPDNPLPFEATQQQTPRPSAARPPNRPAPRATQAPAPARATTPAQSPAPAPAQAATPRQQPAAVSSLRSSARPPSRPEGSLPDMPGPEELTPSERQHLEDLLKDLRSARNGAEGLSGIERNAVFQLAELRPSRRPAAIGARSQQAVAAAQPPTDRPSAPSATTSASTVPARDSGGLLRSSNRPRTKPGQATARLSDAAVNEAIAEAVSASTARPGGVALSALSSSNLPPRRSGARSAGNAAPAPDETVVAAAPAIVAPPDQGPSEAEQAERRRLDEQLQSQAEARIRARAASDAAAEARARAEAEARARAQVAAEERAAAARRQSYKPQELDDEPEIAQNVARGGMTAASVAAAATQRRGIDLGRTTIIGIIGAGNASRALIRLRNGKIVTVRLGDRIDGGTINQIGDGKLTYIKNGRPHEMRILGGR